MTVVWLACAVLVIALVVVADLYQRYRALREDLHHLTQWVAQNVPQREPEPEVYRPGTEASRL